MHSLLKPTTCTLLGLLEYSHDMSDETAQLFSALDIGVLGGHILMVPQRTPLPARQTVHLSAWSCVFIPYGTSKYMLM